MVFEPVDARRSRSGEMTSHNVAAKFWLLSLLTIGSLLHHPARCGSRHDDNPEIGTSNNATDRWHQHQSQSGAGGDDNLNQPFNHDAKATSEPRSDFYDNYNPPEEAPQLEEYMLNLERNRESGYESSDKLPFQEPSDVDFLAKSTDFLNPELEKQINATSMNSNPYEEGILDAEIDRDDSLSDMFQTKEQGGEPVVKNKPTHEDVDNPRFEFLIGMPIENFTGQSTLKEPGVETQTRKPFVPPKSAWPVPQAQFLTAEPKLNHTTGLPDVEGDVKKGGGSGGTRKAEGAIEDYVELVEIAKSGNSDANKSVVTFAPHSNGTGFLLDNDAPDTSELICNLCFEFS